MNRSDAHKSPTRPGARVCLARTVVDSLAEEPALEAVTYDRAERRLSVATLGRTDVAALTDRLLEKIRDAELAADAGACGILTGHHTCAQCDAPLTAEELKHITIEHGDRRTTIARVTCPTAPRFWRWRELPLPRFVQRDVELTDVEEHLGEWKWQLLCAVLCALFGVAAALTVRGDAPGLPGYGFYALAYLAGAWFAAKEFWERLREQGGLDVHFLMLAVAAGSAAVGRWNEGVTLLFLFSLAGALEHFALERTHREIHALFREAPKVARRVAPDGSETEIAVEHIRPGMRLRVRPGDQFPVDAEVVSGQTAADESNLTGESVPVTKGVGDTVLAGTLNLWGAVEVSALRPAAESSLQKIIRLIREAQQQKAPAQRFTERFSAIYTYVVIGAAVAMFFVWWLVVGLPPFVAGDAAPPNQTAFYRTMTLLVVSSPCALVLSIPSAVLAAIAWGARHGVLLRGGSAVEKLAEVNVVALDKTGTLTTGELRVETIESFPPGREPEVARLAYSLEILSAHPLARAITRYGKRQGLAPLELSEFESVTGQGLRARLNGSEVRLGRRDWVLPPGAAVPEGAPAGGDASFSEVWLSNDGLLGRIVLRDDIRPQARAVLDALKRCGLRTVVLTGDRREAAEHLKRELQPDDVRAELKPEDKVAFIRELNAAGHRVAMVGDGVNDAPSLAAAHVGVAMGARGSDAALEQADVVLMHDRLENFLAAFRLSQRARAIIRQNLILSLGTVAVLVGFALAGRIPLTVGVIGHEGSTVLVVMNSLRLLFGNGRIEPADPDSKRASPGRSASGRLAPTNP